MNTKPSGGRGKKAPYQTSIVRVPIPVLPKVEKICNDYRNLIINGESSKSETHPQAQSAFSLVSYGEAVEEAKKILKSKKSAKASIAKLLQVLYGGEVDDDILK